MVVVVFELNIFYYDEMNCKQQCNAQNIMLCVYMLFRS